MLIIEAKPRFEEGRFEIEYKENTAILSWPKPSGDFNKQAIQKKPVQGKNKRSIRECEADCVEEEVPLDLTSHKADIEPDKKYEFKLVLYDGDVIVQSLENPVILGVKGKNVIFGLNKIFILSILWT